MKTKNKFFTLPGILFLSLMLTFCGNSGSNGTIIIGTQTWATKNLDVNTFSNGDPIPEAKTREEWWQFGEEQKAAWCYYENDQANRKKYGKLYNWYAVNDPRGLAPKGWHVPSDAEWTSLTGNLGEDAGIQMKSTSGWSDNGNGTNISGFTALPGGYRNLSCYFEYIGNDGYWWSSTGYDTNYAWSRRMLYNYGDVDRLHYYKEYGFSVRCVRDFK